MDTSRESFRKSYIRLLKERADFPDSLTPAQRDVVLYSELIKAEYLDGDVGENGSGFPVRASIFGIKTKGRLFLQQLEKEERDESTFGRLKKYGLIVFGFIMGIVATLIPDLVKSLLHIK